MKRCSESYAWTQMKYLRAVLRRIVIHLIFCALTIGLHFLQVPKPCHMRLRKGGCQFQRANSKTWCPPGYSFDLSSIRIGKQTFLKRLDVVVDLHTVIKGWRKMAVKTRSDKLGQNWKKYFSPMNKGFFKSTATWSFVRLSEWFWSLLICEFLTTPNYSICP